MAAPNIVDVTSIYGKTAVLAVTTTAAAIISNAGSSGTVVKVSSLLVCNVDGSSDAAVTVDIYRGSTAYHIASTITVPSDATIDLINKHVYLEEGDSLRLTSSSDGDLEALASYEVIS